MTRATRTERTAYAIDTAPGAPGPIAVVRLTGDDVDAACARAGVVAPGWDGAETLARASGSRAGVRMRVGSICGVDDGVIVRWSASRVDLMPHGGVAVVRAVAARLEAAGFVREAHVDALAAFPEAADEVEARMLSALAAAPSPLAIELLLDQPARWRAHREGDACADARLARLLRPPMVVAVGPPNIGKSALLNALAGRSVALVADHVGTTRDAVGAMLELDGLVVRYADLPGFGATAGLAAEAETAARAVLAAADLALWCCDGTDEPAEIEGLPAEVVRVLTRTDRGVSARAGAWGAVRTSATSGEGLGELARAVRERLVPDAVLGDPGAWRFWES